MTFESFDGELDDWLNTIVILRTRAVTRQVLCALYQQVLLGYPIALARTLKPNINDEELGKIREDVVDKLRSHVGKFLDHFTSGELPGGLPFIFEIDEPLRSAAGAKNDEIREAFIEEMRTFFDNFEPKDNPEPDTPSKQFEGDGTYSRLYGSDSAWN